MTYKEMIEALEAVDCDNRGSQTLVNEVIETLMVREAIEKGKQLAAPGAPEPKKADFYCFPAGTYPIDKPAPGERQPVDSRGFCMIGSSCACTGEAVCDRAVCPSWISA